MSARQRGQRKATVTAGVTRRGVPAGHLWARLGALKAQLQPAPPGGHAAPMCSMSCDPECDEYTICTASDGDSVRSRNPRWHLLGA